jgi:hypothetical protein
VFTEIEVFQQAHVMNAKMSLDIFHFFEVLTTTVAPYDTPCKVFIGNRMALNMIGKNTFNSKSFLTLGAYEVR